MPATSRRFFIPCPRCGHAPDCRWIKIRTNNPLERIMREIRRRTRVVGAFPDGQSCLNLAAAARLRHIAGTQWSTRKYSREQLFETIERPAMLPLPPKPFVHADWRKATIGPDHFRLGGHH